jgi:diamine N-acetyltransferase
MKMQNDSIKIKGDKVNLIPASLDDKQKVYEWCFHSETTKTHSGPPDYPENPIATYEEFYESYSQKDRPVYE